MDPQDDQQPVTQVVQRGPGDDDELQSIIEQMHAEKKSKDSIDAVIRVYDDEKHPIRAAFQGGTDGVMKGLMGAVSNTWDTAKGTVEDAISMAQGQTPANAKALVDGMADLPRQWNEGGVRERAELLGNVLAGAAPGIAAGTGLVKGRKVIARTLGNGLEYAGENPFGTRLVGGGAVLTGLATGRPEVAAGGVAAMALPKYATELGQKLRIYGGENAGRVRLGEKGYAKTNSQFDEAMVKRGMEFYDEQAAAKANAARLADIEDAKAGRTASEPDIREATSATQPDGSKSSMSTTFKKSPPAADPNAPPAGWPDGVPYDPSRLSAVLPLRNGAKVTTLGGDRPSIRVMGKPAADLAAAPASPIEQFLQSDPQARIGGEGRMTGQFKEGSGGLSDLQAGRITPNGKAATDVAEGRVPTASRAPQPSDVRMDELAGKLGGQPTPARVDTSQSPVSQSKKPKAATSAFTRDEITEAGGNPDVNYLNMPAQVEARILANRASRHQTNYTNAVSDKILREFGDRLHNRFDPERLR